MIRSELVTRIAEQNPHLYARDVERVVDTIFDRISDALANGAQVVEAAALIAGKRSLSESTLPTHD